MTFQWDAIPAPIWPGITTKGVRSTLRPWILRPPCYVSGRPWRHHHPSRITMPSQLRLSTWAYGAERKVVSSLALMLGRQSHL